MRTEASQRDCPRFDGCSAILCPLAPREYLAELRGFLPGEDEVCGRKELARHPLVARQRRLRNAWAKGLFTLAMLEDLTRVSRGLQGLKLEDSYGAGRRTSRDASRRSSRA